MNTLRATTRKLQRDNGSFGSPEKSANLRTVFAYGQVSETVSQAQVRGTVSDGNGRGESNPIECAVILDSDPGHAESLVDALEDAEIEATAFQAKQQLLEYVSRRPVNFAILVLHSKSWWKDELRLFANSIRYLQETPKLICVLGWPPEGPLDRLYGEALGVAVLHA